MAKGWVKVQLGVAHDIDGIVSSRLVPKAGDQLVDEADGGVVGGDGGARQQVPGDKDGRL